MRLIISGRLEESPFSLPLFVYKRCNDVLGVDYDLCIVLCSTGVAKKCNIYYYIIAQKNKDDKCEKYEKKQLYE